VAKAMKIAKVRIKLARDAAYLRVTLWMTGFA
jgi:hypothetical protein